MGTRRFILSLLGGMVLGGIFVVFTARATGIGDGTIRRAIDRVRPSSDEPEDEPFVEQASTPPTYSEPSPRPATIAPDGGVRFFCDFAEACPLDQFVQYRDGFVVSAVAGEADHARADDWTATNPSCLAPETTRPWKRDEPFGLTYRCLPGGDPALAHQMSVVPNTAGYTFTGSSPNEVFEDVERIAFTVNMTSAGSRNFWEVAVIPADAAFVDAMPCVPSLPCNDGYDYDDIGAMGFSNQDHDGSGFLIGTPTYPDGHHFDRRAVSQTPDGGREFAECGDGTDYCFEALIQEGQQEVRPRFQVVIEDRDDGVWFGQEETDGTMYWVSLSDEHLPEGPVRVVLKFHGYTPTKDGNGPGHDGNVSASVHGFTWHWDNFEVVAAASLPSIEYYGGINPERFVIGGLQGCVAFAQGQRDEDNRTVLPLVSCPDGVEAVDVPSVVVGSVPQALEVR